MIAALGSARLSWFGVAILLAMGLSAALAVVWPLFASGGSGDGVEGAPAEHIRVREDLERSLTSLREVAFDHASGNLSDADFAVLDGAERANAVRLMRLVDGFDASAGTSA